MFEAGSHFISCPALATTATTSITTTTTPIADASTTSTVRGCKKWCAGNPHEWSSKCTWKSCKDCNECSTIQVPTLPKGCKQWCARNSHDWSTKCKWKSCKPCSECEKNRRLQTGSAPLLT